MTLATLALGGCGSDGPERSSGAARIVATTPHVADLARNVAGPGAVRQLLPSGAEPHDYDPRPSDSRAVGEAGLVLRSGGAIDDWLEDVLHGAGGDAETVVLLERIEAAGVSRPGAHWWLDLRAGEAAVGVVRDVLVRSDPGRAAGYRSRAAAYMRRLRRLDAVLEACIRQLPPERRKLVTTHDAFDAFARRYGMEVVGAVIPSAAADAQPSAGETSRLIARIRSEAVPAVFPERALSSKLERTVARESGARVGDPLWVDTLGRPGSEAGTYLGSMAANADSVVRGLSDGRESCPA